MLPATPAEAEEGRQESRGKGAGAGFSKRERLRKRPEFLAVQRRGKRFHTAWLLVVWSPGPCAFPRLGITASRKVGGAVARNRAKRLIREAFRRNKSRLPGATDIVIIASSATPRATYGDIEAALLAWARYAGAGAPLDPGPQAAT